jgi:hypothetical protein
MSTIAKALSRHLMESKRPQVLAASRTRSAVAAPPSSWGGWWIAGGFLALAVALLAAFILSSSPTQPYASIFLFISFFNMKILEH